MNKLIDFLFKLSIFVQICMGAHAWFVWDIENGTASQVTLIVCALIAFLYKQSEHITLKNNNATTAVLILFALAYICTFKLSIPFFIGLALRIYPLWVLLSCRDAKIILNWITKGFVFLLVPGIVLHLLLILTPGFPGIPIQYHDSLSGYFLNYGVLLKPLYAYSESLQYRFYSVFLEPGYLGTLVAFLLYANEYNLKAKNGKILLIAELLSMSLAGYVTAFVGYIIYKYSQRMPIKNYVFTLIVLIVAYYGAGFINNGDNVINHLIVERLQSDDEKGFAGNNRTGEAADYYYEQVMSSEKIFFGLGADEVARINGNDGTVDKATKIHGAGYKIFIITHGLVATFMFLIFYIVSATRLCRRNKRYSYGFVLLIGLTFIQAAYPDSNAWILPFILGIMSKQESETFS